MPTISLNGEDRELPAELTVCQMLTYLDMQDRPLLVEHNGVALLKSEWEEKIVRLGDRLELVQIVAGG